ncbi:MAG TPA: DUF547 domain-containing protein [Vicinamibacteria bacterium]|nr:DUF547 domain-containing protein [Vicinamibacteria bacterium]
MIASRALALALATALCARLATAQPASFDHSLFDTLLRKHVAAGLVDYNGFKKAREFPAYLEALAGADPARLSPPERLAFWINTYNAYTIQVIVLHGERESIRNISESGFALGGGGGGGPWRQKVVRAGGQVYHLDNVEHDIIRKQFAEPRIHFALVCGALGCPPLRSEAYTGARLEDQLADQARVFLRESPAKNRVVAAEGVVYASPILVEWYREDFGGTPQAVGKYLAGFYPEGPEKSLLLGGAFKLEATDYDWTLNSREKGRRK